MIGLTKSTPLDRCYRFAPRLEIEKRDEGAAVYRFSMGKQPKYIGVIICGSLVKPQGAQK